MKIIHIIDSLSVSYGGPAFGVTRLCYNYPKSIDVLIIEMNQQANSEKVKSISPVISLSPGPLKYAQLLSNIITFRPDVVVLHGAWRPELIIVSMISKISGFMPVFFPHGMLDPYFFSKKTHKSYKKKIFHKIIQKPLIQKFRLIVCTSNVEKQKIIELLPYFKGDISCFGYGVNASEIPKIKNIKQKSVQSPYIIFMSRIHPKKGLDLLVKAYSAIKSPDFNLVICGKLNTYFENEISELINQSPHKLKIIIRGEVKGEEKWNLLHNALWMVLPSHQENFGVIIAEALAVNTPVIIGDTLDIAPIIKKTGSGILVQTNVTDLQNTLENLISLDASNYTYATGGTFSDEFMMENVTIKFLKALEK